METFDDLKLISPLKKAIHEEKYTTPTPIQAQCVPPAIEGRDIMGCAQTGTGKTAAFALPILNRLGKRNRKSVPYNPNALILTPTRELAVQVSESIETYGKHLRLRHAVVYGGVSQTKQVRKLERGVHILVATPGRLIDLMNQNFIHLDRLETFVLDEADRMLDMGFLPDLRRIISELPEERQSMFFSATLPPKIMNLAESLLQDPVSVDVTPKVTSVKSIDQSVLYIERAHKKPFLIDFLKKDDVKQAVVFTKTKRGADDVAEDLRRSGINSTAIHSDKTQSARQKILTNFRNRKIRVLVATDLAARGIDIDGISHVVNYELPMEAENYVHRIGRTGRAGASGVAISLCSMIERTLLRAVEKQIGQEIDTHPESPVQRPGSGSEGGQSGKRKGFGPRGKRTFKGSYPRTPSRKRKPTRSAR